MGSRTNMMECPRDPARFWLALAFAGLLLAPPLRATVPLHKLGGKDQAARIRADLSAVHHYRQGLRSMLVFAASRPEIFPPEKPPETRLLGRQEREAVWEAWKRFLDYLVALDAVGDYHRGFYRLKDEPQKGSFQAGYAAFLARYRFALEFIDRAGNHPALDTLLNEPIPEIGLPARTYAGLKFHYLNVARAAEFLAYEATRTALRATPAAELAQGIDEDRQAIWKAGKGRGEALTARNALAMLRHAAFKTFFPVQAKVSEWSGDTKVLRQERSLVTAGQIAAMLNKLEPGDILLERREWYLSNIGLPGFWPHAAIFIGTPEDRRRFFHDEQVRAWARRQGRDDGDFEMLLRSRYPAAYALSLTPQEHGLAPRVLEAISEGVSFTTVEHSADADSVAVLRPRLTKPEKAAALLRAFHYAGRPYDYDFDFRTDAALVCTELVYKAFEPSADLRGLRFPLVEVMGRPVTPANLLARQFDEQHGTSRQQTDLVLFLDGIEREKRAVEASLESFRASWKRPKWHLFVQAGTALPSRPR